MKVAALTTALVLTAGAATACPWAGQTYRAEIRPSVANFTFTFDETCENVVAQRSGRQPETVGLVQVDRNSADHGWYFQFDLFEFLFRVDGQRADARQGGARRPMTLRRQ